MEGSTNDSWQNLEKAFHCRINREKGNKKKRKVPVWRNVEDISGIQSYLQRSEREIYNVGRGCPKTEEERNLLARGLQKMWECEN